MLAAFYIGTAARCAEANKKEELLSQGSGYIRQADFLDINHQVNLVCRGFSFLAQGKLENSTYYFNFAIENHNLAALLGKACSHFHRGFYREALSLYAQALRLNPALPANVRLGLGLCHYKLGNDAIAKKAFQRVLELDPENVDAAVCLAVVEYNSGNMDLYLQLLEQAYKTLPGHLEVLNKCSKEGN
jgi:RNA polymerase-associated protein CTR9